jgi:hypothetical protein
MAENERQALVEQSDNAYDRAVATPHEALSNFENKTQALLEVLVAEARLDRYDREHPFEVAGLTWDDTLDPWGDGDEDEYTV